MGQEADEPRVMLITASAAGKGLTLNRASRVLVAEVMPGARPEPLPILVMPSPTS